MARDRVESGERRPDMNLAALIIAGTPTGALGILFGLILCWKHR